MSSLGSEHNARRSRERVLSRVSTNPLAWLGVSDQSFAAAASSGAPAPSNPLSWLGVSDPSYAAISGAPPPKSVAEQAADAARSAARVTGGLVPGRTLGKATSSTPSGKTHCELYEIANRSGQQAAIVASLRAKCDTEKALNVSSSGSTIPAPNSQATSSEGMSPLLIGAIAVAVGVVGFVAYSRMGKKKKR